MIININLNPYSHIVTDCIGYIKHTDPRELEAERKNFFLTRKLLGIVFEATFASRGVNEVAANIIDSEVSEVVSTICQCPSSDSYEYLRAHISNSLRELMIRLDRPIGAFLSRGDSMDYIEDFNLHGGYVIIKLGRTEHELTH